MKTTKSLVAAAALAAVILVATVAAPAAHAAAPGGAKAALSAARLDLGSMLLYALQDERMARAEYEVIIDRFGSSRPFANIIRAEETHIEWLRELFAAHGMTRPVEAAVRPAAPKDWAAALEAGRQAEIDNIAMYDKFLAQDLPSDVRQVFVQLKAASQNHLRAFTTNLGGRS
jgi:hypothetical protein